MFINTARGGWHAVYVPVVKRPVFAQTVPRVPRALTRLALLLSRAERHHQWPRTPGALVLTSQLRAVLCAAAFAAHCEASGATHTHNVYEAERHVEGLFLQPFDFLPSERRAPNWSDYLGPTPLGFRGLFFSITHLYLVFVSLTIQVRLPADV